ncbi:MAG: hypothetical protein K0R65_908 [Crocinitomicaceae bacterium]|jgi:hexosaminidase|nr:hypothetical protein [Crocinitomicaceae bacterium]
MKNLFAGLFFVLSAALLSAQCPVIPAPTSYTSQKTQFELKETVLVNFGDVPVNIQQHLEHMLLENYGLKLINANDKIPQITFREVDPVDHNDFYSIEVREQTVSVDYTSEAYCFYAVNSLFQLIENSGKSYFIRSGKLIDYPKFSWRGLHLDVSRHFFTVDEVKRYIDLMAFYKFNTFHWHLTDDQGWRIEIKQFPKLTETGAWRDSTVNKHYTTVPRTYTVEKYGGFYTQEQIKNVIKYAADRYITVVPEIEMPGHARAALSAYPELSCTGKRQGAEGLWGVFDDIYCSKKETIDFNKAVLDEVAALFPSPYIHIGGDEAPKERWKKCPDCQRVIRENGLKDEHELQSYFIRQIDAHLTSKGKKLIGWDEILEGGLSPNASVMSWRGFEGGIEAVKQGHAVVMSPGSHCYFDHYQSSHPNEPIAFGGFTPIEKVYAFDPVPPGLSEQESELILGAQANLWTEYIPDMKQLEYMVYPRALALSQVLWSVNKPSYEDFQQVLVDKHLPLLERKGVNYSKAMFYPQLTIVPGEKQSSSLSYQFNKPQNKLSYFYSEEINGKRILLKDSKNKAIDSLPVAGNFAKSFEKYPSEQDYTAHLSVFDGKNFLNYATFTYHIHAGLGLPVKFITPPNKRYAGKELTLVDGVIGRIPWNSSEWIGFDTSRIVLEMDLQEKKTVKSLGLRFLDDESSWIHVPENVEVQHSTDGKKWVSLQQKTQVKTQLEIQQSCRYLRFIITSKTQIPDGKPGAGHVPWTFMDEIIVLIE